MTLVTPSSLTDPLLADLRRRAPRLYALLDPARASGDGPDVPVDFESTEDGGRGEGYRDAQRDAQVRGEGIRTLFRLLEPEPGWCGDHVLLDVLGGDGTVARAVAGLLPADARPTVLTSDLSAGMVRAAQRYGLPAVHQAAQALRLRDRTVDAVLIAYGSHHIPVPERGAAVAEAYRVLRGGGRLALHDFPEGSPVARWFAEVVHPYSRTGHPYRHFTVAELAGLLGDAGFTGVTVHRMYDPFVLLAPTRQAARQALGSHLAQMYGLKPCGPTASPEQVADLAEQCFRYGPDDLAAHQRVRQASYTRHGAGWRVELPRVALVAVGRVT